MSGGKVTSFAEKPQAEGGLINGGFFVLEPQVLDLIGDLALIGRPLLGHVIAERAGHAMHAALVNRIMGDATLYEILTFDQLAAQVTEALTA